MTQNEVDIIKNAVLDSTEAYVDARLDNLDFVKTQIGVVMAKPIKNSAGKYVHRVRCNATRQNPDGIQYQNVLSVGNTPFPATSVVFLIAPNAQFSNQFILGKLDDTPANITAGSIALGGEGSNAPIYFTSDDTIDGSYGHIGGFYIYSDRLEFKNPNGGKSIINGKQIMVSHFIDDYGVSVAAILDADGHRIAINANDSNGTGVARLCASNAIGWDANGNFTNPHNGANYIEITPYGIDCKTEGTVRTMSADAFEMMSRLEGDYRYLRIRVGEGFVLFNNTKSGRTGDIILY